MKSNWREEVEKFRAWAATQDQGELEWETYYGEEKWQEIYDAVGEFLVVSTPTAWTTEELGDLFYLVARDYDVWREIHSQLQHHSDAALYLASASLNSPDTEWKSRLQLADVLGYLPFDPRTEPLLLRFADDEEEFVRRYALKSLARIGSPQTEQVALRQWNCQGPSQQWSRMMALSCWHHINSPLLEPHLREAESSEMEYLADYARRLRNGEVEPL